jgi:hypothetical protein
LVVPVITEIGVFQIDVCVRYLCAGVLPPLHNSLLSFGRVVEFLVLFFFYSLLLIFRPISININNNLQDETLLIWVTRLTSLGAYPYFFGGLSLLLWGLILAYLGAFDLLHTSS